VSDVNLTVTTPLVTLDGGRVSVTVSVTNVGDAPQRIVLGAYGATSQPLPGSETGLAADRIAAATMIERPLREIAPGATEEYVATITRDGATTGTYGLTFIAYPADRAPEEYGDEAQVVQVVVPAAGEAPPRSARRWWFVGLVAGLVVVAAAVAFVLTRPSSVIVPGVVGQSSEDARASLRAAGLAMVVETEVGPEPLDTVIRQEPEEGSEVGAGTEVVVVVQVGVTLPDVVGLGVDDAEAALGDDVSVERVPAESDATPGTVLRMDPPGGTEVGAGTTVRLSVASERSVAVPDTVGGDAEDAIARLRASGLEPRLVRGSLCRLPFAPVCTVVRQDPPAGESVELGATVTITTT
jgi:beta-lactam-binding protein with PASTA domain